MVSWCQLGNPMLGVVCKLACSARAHRVGGICSVNEVKGKEQASVQSISHARDFVEDDPYIMQE